MQPNAFLRNGSSVYEGHTRHLHKGSSLIPCDEGGYQTSYVHHLENPVYFSKEVKVTIEHGHGNHLRNEMSSVAYWYADQPYAARAVPPVEQRLPILRDAAGNWVMDAARQICSREIVLNDEMKSLKAQWAAKGGRPGKFAEDFAPAPLAGWEWAGPYPLPQSDAAAPDLTIVFKPEDGLAATGRACPEPGLWKTCGAMEEGIVDFAKWNKGEFNPGVCYARLKLTSQGAASVPMGLRLDYFARLWVNGQEVALKRGSWLPAEPLRFTASLRDGENEILIKVHPGSKGHAFALNVAKNAPRLVAGSGACPEG